MICLPDDHDRAKRVENRSWPTSHRGPLLIHAGKSMEWLDLDDEGLRDETYDIPVASMAFGAVVAVAELRGCFELQQGHDLGRRHVIPSTALSRWPWLAGHEHAEGPWCWVLAEVRRLPSPIPWKGAQGLWNVPDELRRLVAEALESERLVPR